MQSFLFTKFSPAGNTTIFLHTSGSDYREYYCRKVLETDFLCAEQAAYVDVSSKNLAMGGGEFCINACRAFGALLDYSSTIINLGPEFDQPDKAIISENSIFDKARLYDITASGYYGHISLQVKGQTPLWRVAAKLKMDIAAVIAKVPKIHFASLSGISHLLIQVDSFPSVQDAPILALNLAQQHNIAHMDAYGVTWWTQKGEKFQIMPFVRIANSGTSVLENSCGSASLSLAMLLNSLYERNFFSIIQPGGDILDITFLDGFAIIDGPVSLVAQGLVWLPRPST